jgi:hypothetical protein
MSQPENPLPGIGSHSRTPAGAGGNTCSADESTFLEMRRKVQESELLSSATERLLLKTHFNGRLTVVVHNGRVFKSAYEEGYFRRKTDLEGG